MSPFQSPTISPDLRYEKLSPVIEAIPNPNSLTLSITGCIPSLIFPITLNTNATGVFVILFTIIRRITFTTVLNNKKTLTFLGDEPYREVLKEYCENVNYLLHEAFCLYEERDIFKPYEKHHATAKDACINAKNLNSISRHIYQTCRGERKTAFGFIWKFKN